MRRITNNTKSTINLYSDVCKSERRSLTLLANSFINITDYEYLDLLNSLTTLVDSGIVTVSAYFYSPECFTTPDDVLYLAGSSAVLDSVASIAERAESLARLGEVASEAMSVAERAESLARLGNIPGGVENNLVIIGSSENLVDSSIAIGIAAIPTAVGITLTPNQCVGSIVYLSGAGDIELPAVSTCIDGANVTLYITSNNIGSFKPNAADRFVLYGVALADGHKISSPATAGSAISIHKDSVNGWTVTGSQQIWIDGGL